MRSFLLSSTITLLMACLLSFGSAFTVPMSSSTSLSTQRATSFSSPMTLSTTTAPSSSSSPSWGITSTTTTTSLSAAAAPAILDKPAVAEPQTKDSKQKESTPSKQREGRGGEKWEVRIYNDRMNTREHVARSLVQITGLSESDAYNTMMEAHQNGMAVVGQWAYEIAELYHDRLRSNSIVCDLVPAGQD